MASAYGRNIFLMGIFLSGVKVQKRRVKGKNPQFSRIIS